MWQNLDIRKIISLGMIFAFLANIFGPLPLVQADPAFGGAGDFRLPSPGVIVHLSPEFNPPILKGIKVNPDNPFRFDFILDKGDSNTVIPAKAGILNQTELKQEATRLIKYFLASLTIPEKDLWVNLSPYEKDRIIPQSFGQTEMGRDLLAEDYMLKQITASLIYPEDEIGKKFWKRIYAEAAKKFGTTNISVNTFNKVWIVPEKAVVYENAKAATAYVVESKLKVMLEEDYLALSKNDSLPLVGRVREGGDVNALDSQIIREIVIPELTKEVNEGKNFAQLRQVYNSLILATWYKKKIKDSILAQVYADRNKIKGLSSPNASVGDPQHIYQQYLKAFKKGVYNYIKEEQDTLTQETIPRKYFSGGFDAALIAPLINYAPASQLPLQLDNAQIVTVDCAMAETSIDHAMSGSINVEQVLNEVIDADFGGKVDSNVEVKSEKVLNIQEDSRIRLIFHELLENAFDARKQGSTVRVFVKEGRFKGEHNAVIDFHNDVSAATRAQWKGLEAFARRLASEGNMYVEENGQVGVFRQVDALLKLSRPGVKYSLVSEAWLESQLQEADQSEQGRWGYLFLINGLSAKDIKKHMGGWGVGLNVVKKYLAELGGTFKLSIKNNKITVSVTLPVFKTGDRAQLTNSQFSQEGGVHNPNFHGYYSIGEVMGAVNKIFYALNPHNVSGFVTEENITTHNAEASAIEFYDYLKRLKSEGKLPSKIIVQEWGVGRGSFLMNFLTFFLEEDKSHEFLDNFEYQCYDISQNILDNVRARFLRAARNVNPKDEFKSLNVMMGKVTFHQLDLSRSLPKSETAPLLIRFNELYDDLSGVEFAERTSDGWKLVKIRPKLKEGISIETVDGRAITFEDFLSNYLFFGDLDRLRTIKDVYNILQNLEYEEELAPFQLPQEDYFEATKEYLNSVNAGIGTRMPLNIGAVRNLENIPKLFSSENGGVVQFFDYGFYKVLPGEKSHMSSFEKGYGGHLTVGVNFGYLEFMMNKILSKPDLKIEKQLDWQKRLLWEGIQQYADTSDLDYDQLYQFRLVIDGGGSNQKTGDSAELADNTTGSLELVARNLGFVQKINYYLGNDVRNIFNMLYLKVWEAVNKYGPWETGTPIGSLPGVENLGVAIYNGQPESIKGKDVFVVFGAEREFGEAMRSIGIRWGYGIRRETSLGFAAEELGKNIRDHAPGALGALVVVRDSQKRSVYLAAVDAGKESFFNAVDGELGLKVRSDGRVVQRPGSPGEGKAMGLLSQSNGAVIISQGRVVEYRSSKISYEATGTTELIALKYSGPDAEVVKTLGGSAIILERGDDELKDRAMNSRSLKPESLGKADPTKSAKFNAGILLTRLREKRVSWGQIAIMLEKYVSEIFDKSSHNYELVDQGIRTFLQREDKDEGSKDSFDVGVINTALGSVALILENPNNARQILDSIKDSDTPEGKNQAMRTEDGAAGDLEVLRKMGDFLRTKNITQGLVTIEGVAGAGKTFLKSVIKEKGISGFESNAIDVIETDDFLGGPVDSYLGTDLMNEFKLRVESSLKSHRLVIVVGAHVPYFFSKSSAPLPDVRVYLETDMWTARMRIARRDNGRLAHFLDTIDNHLDTEYHEIPGKQIDLRISNNEPEIPVAGLRTHMPSKFKFVPSEVYGDLVGEQAYDISSSSEFETLSQIIEQNAKLAGIRGAIDIRDKELSDIEKIIVGTFMVLNEMVTQKARPSIVTIRRYSRGLEIAVEGDFPVPFASNPPWYIDAATSHSIELLVAKNSYGVVHAQTFGETFPGLTPEQGARYVLAIPANAPHAVIDHAMGRGEKNGGIDLTPANMNVETKTGSPMTNKGIKFHLDPALLRQLQNAPGFVPVIINIQPMVDLRRFLGVDA